MNFKKGKNIMDGIFSYICDASKKCRLLFFVKSKCIELVR